MTGGHGDVLIPARTFVELETGIGIDLGKIVEQKTEDVRLQPSDILYIPTNGAKAAIIRAGEIGIVIGSALAIYRLAPKASPPAA